jgi:hypothetical protein
MSIPYFQAMMLPFAQHIANVQEHFTTETHDRLVKQFAFTHINKTEK